VFLRSAPPLFMPLASGRAHFYSYHAFGLAAGSLPQLPLYSLFTTHTSLRIRIRTLTNFLSYSKGCWSRKPPAHPTMHCARLQTGQLTRVLLAGRPLLATCTGREQLLSRGRRPVADSPDMASCTLYSPVSTSAAALRVVMPSAPLVFGGCTFLPFSLGPTGDCSCRH